jgi:hypothetical protein
MPLRRFDPTDMYFFFEHQAPFYFQYLFHNRDDRFIAAIADFTPPRMVCSEAPK